MAFPICNPNCDAKGLGAETGGEGFATESSMQWLRARAKVNLTLRVVGRRADGYHELRASWRLLACATGLPLSPATI